MERYLVGLFAFFRRLVGLFALFSIGALDARSVLAAHAFFALAALTARAATAFATDLAGVAVDGILTGAFPLLTDVLDAQVALFTLAAVTALDALRVHTGFTGIDL